MSTLCLPGTSRLCGSKEGSGEELECESMLRDPFIHTRDEWYRANTVFIFTSRKTEIAKSARVPKLQGPLQKTCW